MPKCPLCGMGWPDTDKLIEERKTIHERWHANCKKEKRNTTEGKVIWQ